MNRDQLKRLKELETENHRLRRAVSDLTLDKMILVEAARGVKAVLETVRWTVSGLNGRSP
jgi:putative transposase